MLAAINFTWRLDNPAGPLWDETYYITSSARYAEGRAQFASHPPLGLLLIAAGDAVLGHNHAVDLSLMAAGKTLAGTPIPKGFDFAGVRFASGAFAVLGALLFYLLALVETRRPLVSALFSNLFIFDTAFIAQFRAAQLDAFQMCFAIGSLLCLAMLARATSRRALLAAGVGACVGAAAMVKLDGVLLATPALVVIALEARRGLGARGLALRSMLIKSAAMVVGFCAVLVATILAHLMVGHAPPNATAAGKIDARFISTPYRDYLGRRRGMSPTVFAAATADYARFIINDYRAVAQVDDNGSPPLLQPFMVHPINYRWDASNGRTAYIQLMPNPVAWSIGLLSLVLSTFILGASWLRPIGAGDPHRRALMVALLVTWAALTIAHAVMGLNRVMYLYHYFLPLMFSFGIAPMVFEEASARWPRVAKRQELLLGGMTVSLLIAFLFYAPLAMHRPLTPGDCELRNVPFKVVACRR